MMSMGVASERVQKVMARAGLGSRRGLEQDIELSRVEINGGCATLGAQVGPGDQIDYQGKRYTVTSAEGPHQTLIYHKPEGEITTRDDPEGRKTVFDRLPSIQNGRWIAIGRLDINTAGLLLLTTDGELAHQMMHPSRAVDREYLCRIRGEVSKAQIQALVEGVQLDDGIAKFSDVVLGEYTGSHTWVTVTLLEGRNREVRRLWAAVDAQVARLKRVRFGPVFLPAHVRSGRYQHLTPRDHEILREDVGLAPTVSELILVPEKGRSGSASSPRSGAHRRKKRHRRRH